jgi:clathrin heavy chain
LQAVQKDNLSVINEALNELYVGSEDYGSLRTSIDEYDNFDQIALAQKCEKHDLLEFRRIASYIYRRNKRYTQSVELSKKDKMMKDAIDTTAASNEQELAESLLEHFVSIKDKACFTATLFTCYELIRPDVVMELAWRNSLTDFAMPFMIQYMRHLHNKVEQLETKTAPPPEEEVSDVAEANAALYGGLGMGGGMMMNDTLMITQGPGGYQQQAAGSMMNGDIPNPYANPSAGYGGNVYGGGYSSGYGGGF